MSINFISLNNDAVFSGINLSTRQMPMNPLGNKEVERATTNETGDLKRSQGLLELGARIASSQKTDVDKEPEGNIPWADIMRQLELKQTGDEEEDYNSIMDEIMFQIEHAQSQYDLNYYEWLMEHTNRLFMSLGDANEEYFEEENASQIPMMNMTNMTIL